MNIEQRLDAIREFEVRTAGYRRNRPVITDVEFVLFDAKTCVRLEPEGALYSDIVRAAVGRVPHPELAEVTPNAFLRVVQELSPWVEVTNEKFIDLRTSRRTMLRLQVAEDTAIPVAS